MTRVLPMGQRALLAQMPGLDGVLALYAELQRAPLPAQSDLVTGAESLLVVFDRPAGPQLRAVTNLAQRYSTAPAPQPAASAESWATIEVCYDGPDLAEVAHRTGLGAAGVIAAHTGTDWRVAFSGFAPGFDYLVGGDPRLTTPRRASPRSEVPAGAVGLAGEYSGVYPRASPGGWQIIGRTAAALWDLDRNPPALLRPGMGVRFCAIREVMTLAGEQRGPGAQHEPRAQRRSSAQRGPGEHPPARSITVIKPGIQCLIQDLGRPGRAGMGVSPSGAADRGAMLAANRLVGNPDGAAALEILLGGLVLRAEADIVIAVTGAPLSVDIDDQHGDGPASGSPAPGGSRLEMHQPRAVPAGATVRLGRPKTGLRSYLAIAGGVAIDPVLGSRSSDLLGGIGPAPVRSGDRLPIGPGLGGVPVADGPAPAAAPGDPVILDLSPGPQCDWFEHDVLQRLSEVTWTVSPASDRTAVRLTGPAPARVRAAELPSQGLVRGAIQVPPSGELVAFLADHPVTGGYPVIAVLTEGSADRAAQLRPGQRISLRMR